MILKLLREIKNNFKNYYIYLYKMSGYTITIEGNSNNSNIIVESNNGKILADSNHNNIDPNVSLPLYLQEPDINIIKKLDLTKQNIPSLNFFTQTDACMNLIEPQLIDFYTSNLLRNKYGLPAAITNPEFGFFGLEFNSASISAGSGSNMLGGNWNTKNSTWEYAPCASLYETSEQFDIYYNRLNAEFFMNVFMYFNYYLDISTNPTIARTIVLSDISLNDILDENIKTVLKGDPSLNYENLWLDYGYIHPPLLESWSTAGFGAIEAFGNYKNMFEYLRNNGAAKAPLPETYQTIFNYSNRLITNQGTLAILSAFPEINTGPARLSSNIGARIVAGLPNNFTETIQTHGGVTRVDIWDLSGNTDSFIETLLNYIKVNVSTKHTNWAVTQRLAHFNFGFTAESYHSQIALLQWKDYNATRDGTKIPYANIDLVDISFNKSNFNFIEPTIYPSGFGIINPTALQEITTNKQLTMTFRAWDPMLWPNHAVTQGFIDLSNLILDDLTNFANIINNKNSFINANSYTDASWVEILNHSKNLQQASGKGGPCSFGDFSGVWWVNPNYQE